MTKINHEEYDILKRLDDKWKWIARDEDLGGFDELWLHEYKPKKQPNFWQEDGVEAELFPYSHLFQFIQWEDSEPYSIAWLLGEYEEAEYGYFNNELYERFYEESEETEVKKDIEWVKDKLKRLKKHDLEMWKQSEPNRKSQSHFNGSVSAIDKALDFLDQLDEPEVLSSEWIKDNQLEWTSIFGSEYYVPTKELYGKIVPKQELPTIPQFVSNWIEENKKQSKSFVFAIARIYDNNEIDETTSEKEKRIFQWMELYDNDEVFARAWLDGYTIKKEQKYYVDLNKAAYVAKWLGDGNVRLYKDFDSGSDEYELHLTEQEIKDYDERFWPFRKPVEEVE